MYVRTYIRIYVRTYVQYVHTQVRMVLIVKKKRLATGERMVARTGDRLRKVSVYRRLLGGPLTSIYFRLLPARSLARDIPSSVV